MNISKVIGVLTAVGLFLMANLIAILFLIGNGIIVYGFYRINVTTGTFALGASILLISLVLAKERG
ncbi:hypothetical protein JUJ52_02605 [Virgibacillus sp. AGTR]|uniref:hypothetical protein n=1 Tax=Virgibacillus sp. AGTR TaxID=2812055 RepID=UPI001D169B31|nr:hypothetical protein [Virgibacillus sp. AGTR]MCC2248850.1 hypothetical protein [Virgibacillus sp. AGTR]